MIRQSLLKYEDRTFSFALMVSIGIHLVFIAVLSLVDQRVLTKPVKQIEVTYMQLKPLERKEPVQKFNDMKVMKRDLPELPKDVEIISKETDPFTAFGKQIKDISKLSDKIAFRNKKEIPKIQPADGNRKIHVPVISSEKITNPKYLSYNQSIRQKISSRAYSYVDHPDFKEGNVYLTFVIASDGTLKDLQIIEDKTEANEYLRNVSLRSIREANPFHPFPRDLTYPELTFNVVISFEVSRK